MLKRIWEYIMSTAFGFANALCHYGTKPDGGGGGEPEPFTEAASFTLAANISAFTNHTVRTKYPASMLTGTGTQVRILIQAGPAGWNMTEWYAGYAANPSQLGADTSGTALDYTDTPVLVTFNDGADTTVSLGANEEIWSDPIDLVVNGVNHLMFSTHLSGSPSDMRHDNNSNSEPSVWYYQGRGDFAEDILPPASGRALVAQSDSAAIKAIEVR